MRAKWSCVCLVAVWGVVFGAAWGWAGPLDPTNAPGPTMRSLDEIFTMVQSVNGKLPVFPASVPKTGQTNSYAVGDDGSHKRGVTVQHRFSTGTDGATNCVTDALTGLVWLKNPPILSRVWADALAYCDALDGNDGRGGHADWRLPNWNELRSLIDADRFGPALPAGHPFMGVQNGYYWSSTTVASAPNNAWLVDLNVGQIVVGDKLVTGTTCVWPIRGP